MVVTFLNDANEPRIVNLAIFEPWQEVYDPPETHAQKRLNNTFDKAFTCSARETGCSVSSRSFGDRCGCC